jgi:hypothetical protein
MKDSIIKYTIPILLIIIGLFDNDFWHSSFTKAGIISLLTLILGWLIDNYKQLILIINTQISNRNSDFRLSIAYLYRIKVDNEYLLVKSRTRNYYQPVGGCYKTLPSSKIIFDKLEVKPDRKFETEKGIAKNDLRVYVKGKNVISFLKWFDSKKDREISPWREFCEELISEDILPWRQFRFIDYEFKKKIQSLIIKLDSGGKGIFIFEIFDLVINNEQLPILEKLKLKRESDKFIWVTDDLIQTLGHNEKNKKYISEIAPHTKYAQNLKWE